MLIPKIRFENITLKNLDLEQVTLDYIGWLRDPLVNRYLEVRHSEVNIESQKVFIEDINASANSSIFGIFLDHKEFVGTIKLGNLNLIHKTADVGILVGSTSHHGMGIGTRAISALCNHLGDRKIVRKMNAGVIASNYPSLRAFEKNGFLQEGLRLEQFLGPNGVAEDEILLGKVL
jgi:ribosomal-protein-alanine N-acetyltransferase